MDSPHAIFPPALDYIVDHPPVILHNENCWAIKKLDSHSFYMQGIFIPNNSRIHLGPGWQILPEKMLWGFI